LAHLTRRVVDDERPAAVACRGKRLDDGELDEVGKTEVLLDTLAGALGQGSRIRVGEAGL